MLGRRRGALFVRPRLRAPVRQRLLLSPNGPGDAQRLHHQTVEFVEPRARAVRLVVLLIPDPGDCKPARLFQMVKLPVHPARSTPNQPEHLRALEATLRMAEEQRQDPPPHRGEKGLGEHAPGTWINSHLGNDHTLFGRKGGHKHHFHAPIIGLGSVPRKRPGRGQARLPLGDD